MLAWLPVLLAFASPQAGPIPAHDSEHKPLHKVDVTILGPVAMVEVWRGLASKPDVNGEKRSETILDIDLPDGARVVDWEVIETGKHTALSPQSRGRVEAGLAAALRLRRLSLAKAPVEDGTDYRIHVAPLVDGEAFVLHYRYSAPVACNAGKLALHMPASPEDDPIAADVTVTFAPLPDGRALREARLATVPVPLGKAGRRVLARATAPARTAWDIVWAYDTKPGFPGQILGAIAPGHTVRAKPGALAAMNVVAMVCRTEAAAKAALPPARVILLLDRSRSVGPGGMSAERALARALMETLPPAVRFNAILFGLQATPIFGLFLMPTRESLDGLTAAADPNQLENGTDVVAALAKARALIEAERDEATGRTWVVLVTDGALPAKQTAERMRRALAPSHDRHLNVLVLLVRQRGDDNVPQASLAEYAQLVRKFGGLVHVVPPGNASDNSRAILDTLARGGDWLDVQIEHNKVAEVLPPGQGAHLVGSVPALQRLHLTASGLDGDLRTDIRPALAKPMWLEPLSGDASRQASLAWSGASASVALAILPALTSADSRGDDDIVHGQMDPTVLRNALALAFLPRARACYLSRRAATAADTYLRGRMRLELTIERGELHQSLVSHSTLNHAGIENCVRDAAWAVEYPRPEHRDALTVANLNLVFRPRTAEETRPDASPLDRELEVILGPLTFPGDDKELLLDNSSDKSPSP